MREIQSPDAPDFYTASGKELVECLEKRSEALNQLAEDIETHSREAPEVAKAGTEEEKSDAAKKYDMFKRIAETYGISTC